MMRVAQVAPLDYRSPGGMEVHVMNLAKELILLGFEVDVICMTPNPRAPLRFVSLSEFQPSRYDIVHTHGQHGRDNRALQKNCHRIVHTYHGVLLALLLARGVFTTIFHHPRYYLSLIVQEITGGLFSHRIIAVSNAARKQAARYYFVPLSKITVIPNGYSLQGVSDNQRNALQQSLRTKYGIGDDEFVYLFIGRADPIKGIERTLKAFEEVHSRHPDTRLVLIPGFPDKVSNAVISTGEFSFKDIWALYLLGDVLVNSSYYEGFPVVVPEAMATGLPVIAPQIGGIVDIVQDGVNGLLVDKACRGLARAMERVYLAPVFRAGLSKGAVASVRHLSWTEIAERTVEVYRSLLNADRNS